MSCSYCHAPVETLFSGCLSGTCKRPQSHPHETGISIEYFSTTRKRSDKKDADVPPRERKAQKMGYVSFRVKTRSNKHVKAAADPLGFCWQTAASVAVSVLWVESAYRGGGVGTGLMRDMCTWLETAWRSRCRASATVSGSLPVSLMAVPFGEAGTTQLTFTELIAFYERFGFKPSTFDPFQFATRISKEKGPETLVKTISSESGKEAYDRTSYRSGVQRLRRYQERRRNWKPYQ